MITWLGHSDCQETARVGAKTANLSKLFAAHPVPNGFCITTDAYQCWSEKALSAGDNLPADVANLVQAAYASFAEKNGGAPPPLAVRSSAVGEDSQEASFAGQYETCLNVMGKEQLLQSILRCWAAADGARVQHYRRQHVPHLDKPMLAVLVQEMIAADSSLVAFSMNPVSGSAREVIVNATWGLGETLVGGTVTPDSFVVDKSNLSIQHRHVAEKMRMTVPAPLGVREIAVPRMLRTRASLTDRQVNAVARLAINLEQSMGWPVDIECAWRGENLYLLQCRPITTVGTLS